MSGQEILSCRICGAGAVMRGMVPASSKKYADRVLQMAAKSGIYSKASPGR